VSEQDYSDGRSPFKALQFSQRQRFVVAACTTTMWFAVSLIFAYGLMWLFLRTWQAGLATATMVLTAILMHFLRRLAQRGAVNVVSYIWVPYMQIMVGSLSVLLEIPGAIAPAFASFILVSAMVLSPAVGYGMTTFAAVLWIIMHLMAEAPLQQSSPLGSFGSSVVTGSVVLVCFYFITFISYAATGAFWRALDASAYELVEANRQLEQASSLKTRFLARMSHDLRSPLNAILLSIDLSLRKIYGPLTDKQEEVLERSVGSARRLNTLINDILDISRIEAGELKLTEDKVDVKSLVKTLQTTMQSRAADKGLDFSISLASEMPPVILADEMRLLQVLTNLTDNAIKYTDRGSVSVRIELSGAESWRMVVRDTGRGIHESDLEVIFQEFRQAEAASATNVRGTGLGLAITRHIVELLRGEIMVRSRINEGSTFEVLLPLKEADKATQVMKQI
jgi:signal transduction histidine kinase